MRNERSGFSTRRVLVVWTGAGCDDEKGSWGAESFDVPSILNGDGG